ncbi:sulfurtransferase TusA family protein, partial [Staphylococcus aureus]|nr:sulfurtransferase TusA family protein [Staphylococcus aureus]
MVCPFQLIEAQKKMATLQSGDELNIDFDCTQATEAIPYWAAENGYPVTNYEQID